MEDFHKVRIAIPEIGQNVCNYVNALRGVGAEPVVVSIRDKSMKEAMQKEYLEFCDFRAENYDGLLLPGGVDVEPSRYGEENHGSFGMVPELDELQLSALDQCVKAGIPVFGICRGMQLINVYFGGNLIQDIPTAADHARYSLKEDDKVHEGRCERNSWVERIYGSTFFHNSAHHQAVGRPGEGLVVDEYSVKDGVVEAMHHESLPVHCVQWHPERMCFANARKDTVDGSWIVGWFVAECRRMKKREVLPESAVFTGGML